jgi:hypothetical protein
MKVRRQQAGAGFMAHAVQARSGFDPGWVERLSVVFRRSETGSDEPPSAGTGSVPNRYDSSFASFCQLGWQSLQNMESAN